MAGLVKMCIIILVHLNEYPYRFMSSWKYIKNSLDAFKVAQEKIILLE